MSSGARKKVKKVNNHHVTRSSLDSSLLASINEQSQAALDDYENDKFDENYHPLFSKGPRNDSSDFRTISVRNLNESSYHGKNPGMIDTRSTDSKGKFRRSQNVDNNTLVTAGGNYTRRSDLHKASSVYSIFNLVKKAVSQERKAQDNTKVEESGELKEDGISVEVESDESELGQIVARSGGQRGFNYAGTHMKANLSTLNFLDKIYFWTFTKPFSYLILIFLIVYLTFCFGFAGIFHLWLLLPNQWECSSDGEETDFIDSFALSWTTFSTVGYGNIYPDSETSPRCIPFVILASLEGFLGILYAGFCGALFFSKVIRNQSEAKVSFSECVCVTYKADPPKRSNGKIMDVLPPPELRFRIVNKLANIPGAELIDTFVRCNVITYNEGSQQSTRVNSSTELRSARMSVVPPNITSLNKNNAEVIVKDDMKINVRPTNEPMELTPYDVGYFPRVLIISHSLDSESPLLKRQYRELFRLKGGWPKDYNNPTRIRECLKDFDLMTLTLSGTDNTSGVQVFARHIYYPTDFLIGYRFAEMSHVSTRDQTIVVDFEYLNDVRPQGKGQGEDLKLLSESQSNKEFVIRV